MADRIISPPHFLVGWRSNRFIGAPIIAEHKAPSLNPTNPLCDRVDRCFSAATLLEAVPDFYKDAGADTVALAVLQNRHFFDIGVIAVHRADPGEAN